jgi:peptide deformylase
MAIMPIIIAPDARLKMISKPVERVDNGVRRLMDDMVETMYAAPGIGLSAIQVGVARRVIVIDLADESKTPPLFMANPELSDQSGEVRLNQEGCLSLPDQFADVERPEKIKVRFLDYYGEMREIEADGMLAVCIQHEMDHLEGILFVDHLSALKRGIVIRKLQKLKRLQATASL